jgi:hypothetical protein
MADSNNKFLDLEGLKYYDGKIKNYIDNIAGSIDLPLSKGTGENSLIIN